MALTDIREAEIRIDLMIIPVEEAYVMLNKYQLTFNDGNAERVDTISYSWKLLKQQVSVSFCCRLMHWLFLLFSSVKARYTANIVGVRQCWAVRFGIYHWS